MVLAQRAHRLLDNIPSGRGVAFLSFTKAAVSELELRLRDIGVLRSPVFPSFVGTFDSFVWTFLVAPFGVSGSEARPHLVGDIDDRDVRPYSGAQALPLYAFEPGTGEIIPDAAKRRGFDVARKQPHQVQAYETAARRLRSVSHENGFLGFQAARTEALARLRDEQLSPRIARALAGRFVELVVDEAQDCNPDDLEIITWLRGTGIPVKVVCDPNQAIYGFRGGVTSELDSFEATFRADERLGLNGNFRSTPSICRAIAQFRPVDVRGTHDTPLGRLAQDRTPVHVITYPGPSVVGSIGQRLSEILDGFDIEPADCPVVAATKASAESAVGRPRVSTSRHRAVRLAEAVTTYQFASGFIDVRAALERAHELFLDIEGHLSTVSYGQYLADEALEPVTWRPQVMATLNELRFDPTKHKSPKGWHDAAKSVLNSRLTIPQGRSIAQMLSWNAAVEGALIATPTGAIAARTIHSVKGMEFPAVCVVTTTSTLKQVLDYLDGGPVESAEEARKLYVAMSRAQRLLVVASPESQAERLVAHLAAQDADIVASSV